MGAFPRTTWANHRNHQGHVSAYQCTATLALPPVRKGNKVSDDNVARQMLAAVQVDKAMKLRARGAHWGEVAEACGYSSPGAALRAVGEAMKAATARAEMTADQLRDEANLRLENLLREALDMIPQETFYGEKGQELDDRAVRLRAVDEARRIVESLAKLNRLHEKDESSDSNNLRIEIVGLDPLDLI